MTADATSADVNLESVVRKIRKLLARKTEDGASEAEAETASQMVQELMAKYNLDMAAIEAAGTGAEDASSVRVKELLSKNTKFEWQRELARGVAEANFCYYMVNKDYAKDADGSPIWFTVSGMYRPKVVMSHVFVGRKANVVTSQLMYEYLMRSIDERVPIASNAERFSRFALSWKAGAADRLCERLSKRKREIVAAHDAAAKAAQAAAEEEARKAEALRLAGHEYTTAEQSAKLRAGAHDARGMGGPAMEPERPEASDTAWRPGEGAVPATEPAPPVVAMVLASAYDASEEERNREFAHGLEAGYYARRRAEREAERREEEAEAREVAAKESEAESKAPETERQRRKREREEKRQQEANQRRWARQDRAAERKEHAAWMKKDHSAYRDGAEAAKGIGLDPQVKAKADALRLAGK